MADTGTLLIDFGDLPSLVAATIDPRPQRLRIYHPRMTAASATWREAIAVEHATLLGTGDPVLDPHPVSDPAGPLDGAAHQDEIEGLRDAGVLVRAAHVAVHLGVRRIVWPKVVGPHAGRVGRTVQRATMVAALADLDARVPISEQIVIDVPLVDLTDEQLVDLAEDAGAPMRSFRACDGGAADPCGRCDGCRRWLAAFDAAGVPWPWLQVAAGAG